MRKLKKYLLDFINCFSASVPINLMMKITGKKHISPVYHGVSDQDELHIKYLYPVKSVMKFEEDLDFFNKHFNAIDLDTLIKTKVKNNNNDNKTFFLSFDDGLSSIYHTIAPILVKKGIPAHIFINSAFVDNKALMFRYKQSLLVEKLVKRQNSSLIVELKKILCKNEESDSDVLTGILNLKYHQSDLLDQFAELLDVDFMEFLNTYKPYLTKEQIHSLIKSGFTFGSHSIDHPEFRYIDMNQQIKQIEESVSFVTNNFSPSIKTFAFPFTDFGVKDKLFKYIKDKGLIDYTFGGAGIKNEKYDFHFQRIPMEETTLSAKKIIHTEYFYYIFKMPFGKNSIKRK